MVLTAIFLRLFVVGSFVVNQRVEGRLLQDSLIGLKIGFGFENPFTSHRFGFRPPKRLRSVLFLCDPPNSEVCIGKVVGLGGDLIEVRRGEIRVNDEPVLAVPEWPNNLQPLLLEQGRVAIVRHGLFGQALKSPIDVVNEDSLMARPWVIWYSTAFDLSDENKQEPTIVWERLFTRLD